MPASSCCPYCAKECYLANSVPRQQLQWCPDCQEILFPALNTETGSLEGWVPADLGEFTVEAQVGCGGMGHVFRGRRNLDRHPVAIKFPRLEPPASQQAGEQQREQPVDIKFPRLEPRAVPEAAVRFVHEVETLRSVNHINVVAYLSHGITAGRPYCVMEWVEGQNLACIIDDCRKNNHLPKFDLVLSRFDQLCAALMALHDRGLIHRDIKPSNIILTPEGVVKLIDLGIAKSTVKGEGTRTAKRSVVGSMNYLAPEQFSGSVAIDHRADIYALGVVIYEWLTGALPRGRVRPPSTLNNTVPAWFDRVIDSMMEGRPESRPDLIRSLLALIESARTQVTSPPITDQVPIFLPALRVVGPVAASAGVLAVIFFAAGLLWIRASSPYWLAIAGALVGFALRETTRRHADAIGVSRFLTLCVSTIGIALGVIAGFLVMFLAMVSWWITRWICALEFSISVEPRGWWVAVAPLIGTVIGAVVGMAIGSAIAEKARSAKVINILKLGKWTLSADNCSTIVGAILGGSGTLILSLVRVIGGPRGDDAGSLVLIGLMVLVGIEIVAWTFVTERQKREHTARDKPTAIPFVVAPFLVAIGIIYAIWFAEPVTAPPATSLPTFVGHTNGITALAISPDGKYAVSGAMDHTLRLWRTSDHKEIHSFAGHTDTIWSVAFSFDGKRILSGGNDGIIRIWDCESGGLLRQWDTRSEVWCVAFTPDGRRVLSGGGMSFEKNEWKGDVIVWDAETANEIKRLKGHTSAVAGLSVSKDGRYVLSGGNDKTVRLWNLQTFREERRFQGHTESVWCVAFSPDGKLALSGGVDNTVRLWDVDTGNELRRWQGHEGTVYSVAFSPDGRRVLSGALDMTVRLWDLKTGAELTRLKGHLAHFLSDGRSVICARWNPIFRIYKGEKEVSQHSGPTARDGFVTDLFIAKDGRVTTVIAPLFDSKAKVLIESGHSKYGFPSLQTRVTLSPSVNVSTSRDGRIALTGGGMDERDKDNHNILRLWDLDTGRELRRFGNHDTRINKVVLSPDGRRALSNADGKSEVYLWDVERGVESRQFRHEKTVSCFDFSPDCKYILTGSGCVAYLWDAETGIEVRRFEGHTTPVLSVCFSPDCRRILSGAGSDGPKDPNGQSSPIDCTVRLWDVSSGRAVRVFQGHENPIEHVAFSPDGCCILATAIGKWLEAGHGRHLRSWDTQTGRELSAPDGRLGAYFPDGRLLTICNEHLLQIEKLPEPMGPAIRKMKLPQ